MEDQMADGDTDIGNMCERGERGNRGYVIGLNPRKQMYPVSETDGTR